MVDELPQQKFLVPWRQVEPQTGLLDGLVGAMPLFGKPLEGVA